MGLKRTQSRWRKKISLIVFIFISGTLFLGSYVFPFFEKSQGFAAILMILRSIIIMLVWYFLLAPFVLRKLQKYLNKKQSVYSFEIQHILQIFPALKDVIRFSWRESRELKGYKRLAGFMESLLLIIITIDIKSPETQAQ